MKIFPTKSIKRIDALTIEREPISSLMLMERAAVALAGAILEEFPRSSFAIFAGQGNNGGDALAVARMLATRGRAVRVWVVAPEERLSPDCKANLQSLQAMIGRGSSFSLKINRVSKKFATPTIDKESVIIDGLFGSGLTRPTEGVFSDIIHFINACGCKVAAIDIPSGLMGEDNSENNYNNIVRATVTYTLQSPKLSMLFAENDPFVGTLRVLDISLNKEAMELEPSPYFMTTAESLAHLSLKRDKHAHKGTFGRALLVAGSKGMAGASVLSARAALRSGAGLLTLHIPYYNNNILQRTVPEAMTLCDTCETHLSTPPSTNAYNAVAVGPGLGRHPDTEKVLLAIIENCKAPMVIDADALNILSLHKDYLSRLPEGSIITPHIGEFTRLTGESANSYERLQKARELATTNNLCVVLKGAYTAVVTPAGDCFFNTSGNAGMATGGSGDVLTGILLALLARGLSAGEAARLGVFTHGRAGDIAAQRTGETALVASDIIDALPTVWKEFEEKR